MHNLNRILFSGMVIFALVVVPNISFAVGMKTLNGLTAADQFLAMTTGATTMHMNIVSANNTHTFQWDATPWTIAQGGTGATSFTNGSVLFFSGGVFSQDNGNFFWNPVSHFLGIGNANPQHALDVSGAMYSRLVTLTDSPTLTVDWNMGNVQSLMLNTNTTFAFSNGQAGGEYKLLLKQDGTGGKTVTWPADVQWPNGTAPTLTSNANGKDVISFMKDGDGFYLGSYTLDYLVPTSGIAFDNVSDGNCTANCSSELWSHTTSGSNRILFVECVFDTSTDPITAISYGGDPMNFLTSNHYLQTDNSNRYLVAYYLTNPLSGANNVSISFGSTTYVEGCWATSYTGAAQSGVPDNVATSSASLVSSISTTFSPVANGSWIVSLAGGERIPVGWTGSVGRGSINNGFGIGDTNSSISGSHMTTYTLESSTNMGIISWSFAPAQ